MTPNDPWDQNTDVCSRNDDEILDHKGDTVKKKELIR